MILLTENDKKLLAEMEGEISKEELQKNWKRLMEYTPLPSGSPQEEAAIHYLKERLEEYGLKPQMLYYEAHVSEPKWAKLEILSPQKLEVQCTPYRQVGTTGPEGIEEDVTYIGSEDIGRAECRGKIVLAEQTVPGDWMGLQGELLLKLQQMGVKGLIVIEQDAFMPTVAHQRADFSVSGNPTSENFKIIQTIPAIVHISNKDGQILKSLAKQGGMRVRVTSIMTTGWKRLPLLVAQVRGTKDPEKFVMVNGHVDTPPFSPGAVDNVSGNIAILELARVLNKHRDRLDRSVRFAFWTGHEIGRYAGSTWYNDAFWHELRYRCVGLLNIDSPGTEGATTYRAVPIGEMQDLAVESIKEVTGIEVKSFRWSTRAGDNSFWGTGLPNLGLSSARPEGLYDPFVNYSGGGWWWHSPWDTIDRGDVDILVRDIKVELNYVFKMANCQVLPVSFVPYAEAILKILQDFQSKADKIRAYFSLEPVIERAREFRELAKALEDTAKKAAGKGAPKEVAEELNRCIMWVSRYVNLIAHSNAEPTEQMSMETFGSAPFPRIQDILKLIEMPFPHAPEFKLLSTKLLRQRNYVEDDFYLANEKIRETLAKVGKTLA